MPIADRPTELSEQVLESVGNGQQAALEAVRKFAETVDKLLPLGGEGPSKRQEVIGGAFEMADRLVQTQYDFLRSVVRSAGVDHADVTFGEVVLERNPEVGGEAERVVAVAVAPVEQVGGGTSAPARVA